MTELTHVLQQFIAWLIGVWTWLVGVATPLWQTIPYHTTIATIFSTWYAQGFLTVALLVIVVFIVFRWVWLSLYGIVQRSHYDKAAVWYRAISALISHERAVTQRGMVPIHQARRRMKNHFYTYQLGLIRDVQVRHEIRELVHLVNEDAATFDKAIVFKNIYQLHTFAEAQLNTYPRSIRLVHWIMTGVWQRQPS